MKQLTSQYKNKFRLILDIIFKPKQFSMNIEELLNKQANKLEQNFQDKIELLHTEKYFNGIMCEEKEYPVLIVPIADTQYSNQEIHGVDNCNFKSETLKKIKIKTAFYKNSLSVDELKKHAAYNIAKLLLDNNVLHAEFVKDSIIFYINFLK